MLERCIRFGQIKSIPSDVQSVTAASYAMLLRAITCERSEVTSQCALKFCMHVEIGSLEVTLDLFRVGFEMLRSNLQVSGFLC
ncbi:MAG: hypothetical protein CBE00_09870 [Planctomycetaceae bacterium TMED240]|nr:MAG: hypothetical protein CBE00_09870 [Planctomycetaceae bacterium TMED240]